jgi:prophage regulatory protein
VKPIFTSEASSEANLHPYKSGTNLEVNFNLYGVIMTILNKKEVVDRTSLSPSTIWRRMQAGDFPESVQLSPGKVGWHEEEIEHWIESRPRGVAQLPANLNKSPIIYNPSTEGSKHGK